MSLDDISPGNPGFRPSSHSAVQLESLALPDGLSTGLDDKLRTVCQAVRVHFPTKLYPLIHLKQNEHFRLHVRRCDDLKMDINGLKGTY